MEWLDQIKRHLKGTVEYWVDKSYDRYHCVTDEERNAMTRKKQVLKDRKARIEKSMIDGKLIDVEENGNKRKVDYLLHMKLLIKQKQHFYVEEQIEERQAIFEDSKLLLDRPLAQEPLDGGEKYHIAVQEERSKSMAYNRLEAVKYADRWWNSHNPQFKEFDVDCTNFISQCIHAGGVPMSGKYNKTSGWWFEGKSWSYSWTVANALRWYLSKDRNIMGAVAVERPDQLVPGDVICLDFEGDGKWDHTTFVTERDANGMPLVNAHTVNSRHRYWSYEDSTAWTENIKYKFFHIKD
ncbi:amidase domain-containing protein [Scopulibacillus darangshiensis]|nr:amidase domain-containing protein [Scopulibacillus darangshiensis]